MSLSNSNQQPTKSPLSKVQLQGLVKVIIPEDFETKVKFLCRNIPKVEWSGILFYDIAGTIQNTEEMVITVRDILLMDKGTSGYTEYAFTEEVMDFMMDNDLSGSQYGHIHSHNTMGVFFSGTDWDELNDNCQTRNIYLSLIVNNFMDMEAKIAFVARPTHFTCPDENGEMYSLLVDDLKPVMFVYDCDVIQTKEELVVPDEFAARLGYVEKQSEIKAKEKKAKDDKEAKERADAWAKNPNNPANKTPQAGGKVVTPNFHNGPSEDYELTKAYGFGFEEADFADQFAVSKHVDGDYDDFLAYVLRFGVEKDHDTVESALKAANDDYGLTDIVGSIITNYATYFDRYFETDKHGVSDEEFMDTIEEFILVCQVYVVEYEWLGNLEMGLRSFGNQYELLNLKTQ